MKLGAVLELQDRLSAKLEKAASTVKGFSDKITKANESVQKLGRSKVSTVIEAKDLASSRINRVNYQLRNLGSVVVYPTAQLDDQIISKLYEIKAQASLTAAHLKGVLNLHLQPLLQLKDEATKQLETFMTKARGTANRVIFTYLKFKDDALKKIPDIKQKLVNLSRFVVMPTVFLREEVRGPLNRVKSSLQALSGKVFTPLISLKDQASTVLGDVTRKLRILNTAAATPIIKARDALSGKLGELKDKVMSLQGLLAGLVIGGVGKVVFDKTVGAQMEQENQMISMTHFLGGDKGKADQMMAWLQKNAAQTPFEMSELTPAASRAVGVTGGNVTQAQQLIKLAEDMAALNPGKSVGDAMEALADARNGEFERMKEFNMKYDAETFKSKGFDGFINDANKIYEGGAAKLGQSATGLVSTITDNINTPLRNMGAGAFELLKPKFNDIVNWFNNNQGLIESWTKKGSQALSTIVSAGIKFAQWVIGVMPTVGAVFSTIWSIAGPILNALADTISWLAQQFAAHKAVIMPIIMGIAGAFVYFGYIVPFLAGIPAALGAVGAAFSLITWPMLAVAAVIALLYAAWTNNWGGIQQKTHAVIQWLSSAFQAVVGFLSSVWAGMAPAVMSQLQLIWSVITNGFGLIVAVVSAAWNMIKGIIMVGWSLISGVIMIGLNILQGNWAGAWNALKGTVVGVFNGIKTFLSGFVGGLFDVGVKIVSTIVSGIKSMAMAPVNAVKGIFGAVGKLMPHSDADEGPFSRLTASGQAFTTTFSEGVSSKGKDLSDSVNQVFQKTQVVLDQPEGQGPLNFVNRLAQLFQGPKTDKANPLESNLGLTDKSYVSSIPGETLTSSTVNNSSTNNTYNQQNQNQTNSSNGKTVQINIEKLLDNVKIDGNNVEEIVQEIVEKLEEVMGNSGEQSLAGVVE